MTGSKVCWNCGASIEALPYPLGRLAKCPACASDLHVCLLCRFYDTGKANHCQEPIAEPVLNKRRSNFCELFQPKSGAYQSVDSTAADVAQQQLAALFGEDSPTQGSVNRAEQSRSELEKLFGIDEENKTNDSDISGR